MPRRTRGGPRPTRHPAHHPPRRGRGDARTTAAARQASDLLVAHEETGTGVTYARDRRVRRWAARGGRRISGGAADGRGAAAGISATAGTGSGRKGWKLRWRSCLRSTGHAGRDAIARLATAGILGSPRSRPACRTRKTAKHGGERACRRRARRFPHSPRPPLLRRYLQPALGTARAAARLSPYLAFGGDLTCDMSGRRAKPAGSKCSGCLVIRGSPARHGRTRRPGSGDLKADAIAAPLALPLHAEAGRRAGDRVSQHAAGCRRPAGKRDLDRTAPGLADRRARATRSSMPACAALVATGWLTFRMRALVVSFASYSLWLHWRPTGLPSGPAFSRLRARHPLVAVCRCKAAPRASTRCESTTRPSRRSTRIRAASSSAAGCRSWPACRPRMHTCPGRCPADVQQAAGCLIGRDYPAPIVDHAAAIREAKRRLAGVRNASDARAEARDVAQRHGSRRDRRGAMQQDPVRLGDSPARRGHERPPNAQQGADAHATAAFW